MRILNIVPYTFLEYDKTKTLGCELVVYELSRKLKELHPDIDIDFLKVGNIPEFNTINIDIPTNKQFYNKKVVETINNIHNNYDIININVASLTVFSTFSKYLSRDIKSKIFITIHIDCSIGRSAFMQSDSIKKLGEDFSNIELIFPSVNSYNFLRNHPTEGDIIKNFKCHIINNYVNISDISKVNLEKVDKIYDVSINSRIISSKNSYEMLDYCVSRNLKVCYIGYNHNCKNPEDEEYLKNTLSFIEEHKDLITHKYDLSHYDALKEMSKSKLFMHLSLNECFSLSVLEALCLNLPVLCRDLKSYSEYIDSVSRNLFIIKSDDLYRKFKNGRYNIYDKYIDTIKNSNLFYISNNDLEFYSLDRYAHDYYKLFKE